MSLVAIVSLGVAVLGFWVIRFSPPPGRWSVLRTITLVIAFGASYALTAFAGVKAHELLLGDTAVPAESKAGCLALVSTVILGIAAAIVIGLVLSP